ncbi:MAG: hypothetical protein FWD56_02840 [Bacteroidales bacterium]|nr:hypothetical protein [Bacteroidales bacterium]
MKRCILFLFMTVQSALLYAQLSPPDSLASLFRHQLEIFPQEKIYVHTDKPYYVSGETIWFRAYLVDAVTHIPAFASRYVYVELINRLDSVVTRVKIREADEAYHGHLLIHENTPEGNYTLRAYTTYMRSLDEEYFFTKNVFIGVRQNLENTFSIEPSVDSDFDVSFFPEGGSLMAGTVCKIAFKAVKSNGQAVDVIGTVYNESGEEVGSFISSHLGMGSFHLLPQKGGRYYAVCENSLGQSAVFDLPTAQDYGYALSVNQFRGIIHVSVVKPVDAALNDELYLLAHTRGMIQLIEPWDHSRNRVAIPQELLPSGVLHLILFDSQLNTLSERLVFVNNHDQAQVSFSTDNEHYAARSLVKSRVTVTDIDGMPLEGSFSVSVTSDREVTPDSAANILTQLLLTSDLRGHIENPAYYFGNTMESIQALDLLMLTQGWRRYHTAEMAQGRFRQPTFPLELGVEVSGRVQTPQGVAVKDVEVSVATTTLSYHNTVQTDSLGRFQLSINEFADSTRFVVTAQPPKDRTRLELLLDAESFPNRTISFVPPTELSNSQFSNYANNARLQYALEDGIRTTQLSAAVVTAERKQPSPYTSHFYQHPPRSNTLTEEHLERYVGPTLHTAMLAIPRVQMKFDDGKWYILLRYDPLTRPADQVPLILLDDMPTDYHAIFDILHIRDVARIDVLTSDQAVIFGMRGYHGVISIFTKRDRSLGSASNTSPLSMHIKGYSPLGYQQPAEFYAPKYETESLRLNKKPDLRTTIHWQPVVLSDENGVASFEFFTADEQTSYTVTIEGLADDGAIIWKQSTIYASAW